MNSFKEHVQRERSAFAPISTIYLTKSSSEKPWPHLKRSCDDLKRSVRRTMLVLQLKRHGNRTSSHTYLHIRGPGIVFSLLCRLHYGLDEPLWLLVPR